MIFILKILKMKLKKVLYKKVDYEWYDYHNCYVSKKYKDYFFEYYENQNYSVNGELIAVRKRCNDNGPDYWGGINQEGQDYRVEWID